MSNNRDEIRPPQSIPATPPACAEARAIAKDGVSFKQFQDDLQATIDANTPTWRKVLQNLFKGE
jgi:hypothetical protein